jgi:predicted dehydrogenase
MSHCNRREFLKCAAASGIAAKFAVSGTRAFGRVVGANDRVRIAVAGINGRGQTHMQVYGDMKNVEIAYLVDPNVALFAPRSAAVKERTGNMPKCVRDLREALDDKTLDAVSIAASNHWHTLLAIWACQAGKDVYVEKPCSHNIFEGRKLVEAARRYDRIVQHGTQNRSDPNWSEHVAAIQSGKYGKLRISYGYASKPRGSIGFKQPQEPPSGLDYNLWIGPAPMQPYRTNLVPYNWHWVWDFGNGEIGNQGIHQLDVARWAMPAGAVPRSVISLGGRFGYKDQGQTPNTQLTIIDYGDAKLFFEDRGLVNGKTMKVTNEFYTDEGVVKNGKVFAKGKMNGEPIENAPVDFSASPPHFQNFIDCVRSRNRAEVNAEIFEGHKSSLLAHLGNISYRLGTDTAFNKETKAFGDDKTVCESFESMKQHLVAAAKLELADTTYRLGRALQFDARAEQFVGDEDANRLLTRTYRSPFVVPEHV